ncbi:MAG: arginine--tRNA ligase [Actinomycetota bacterium]|nr:arginine--tRNA ligase [Actinomycetota bacterium]
MVTDALAGLVSAALKAAMADGVLASGSLPEPLFERPKRPEHGDWATNIALVVGRGGVNPRSVAAALVERLPSSDLVDTVEVAGPGFLNFHLSPKWLRDVVQRAADPASGFGRSSEGRGLHINLEYVSANPTGPMNVVSGRHAAVGDALAGLLEATGHKVTREFLINDEGRQLELFAQSVAARYLQHFGVEAELPEDGYQGEYLIEVAGQIADEIGDSLVRSSSDQRVETLRDLALQRMLDSMRSSLERFGSHFDVWFSERKMHDSGAVSAAIERLRGSDFIDERDNALWFRSSQFGDDKDRVVVRSNGTTTYLAADVAYLLDKAGRGYDQLIYLWGADHHGTITRMLAAAQALGLDREQMEIRLIQNVSLLRKGVTVKASKRAGEIIMLDELVDEVGRDAARYTFLTRSMDAPLEFDIELVKQESPENPVYYVQYAHARICSILKRAGEQGVVIHGAPTLEPLGHPSEGQLMRKLSSYEETVPQAAQARAPQKLTRYLEELGTSFTAFYRDCRVISDDRELSQARLALCIATKRVIADGLGLIGVSAPESM